MTTFDDRKKAQENKYAHDEELKFKVRARAAKHFGTWVAQQTGAPAETYANELVNLVIAGKSDAEIIKKSAADAKAKGKDLSAELLGEKLNRLTDEAKDQVLKS